MKSAVRVKLRVTPEQAVALTNTLTACNAAANTVSDMAFGKPAMTAMSLQKLAYGPMKQAGLSAQPALHVIRKTAGAYRTLRANVRAGNYGRPGSKRHTRATGKPIRFRLDGAQPFDDRCLSWQLDEQTVSIWTVASRIRGIPFVGHPDHLAVLRASRKGESDLVAHQGNFYLLATIDVPEPAVTPATEFLGVDMGIVNIATLSTGERMSGSQLNRVRNKNVRLRAKLQRKGTTSATRVLKNLSGRESRFSTNTNHVISKRIVAEAKRTGKGIAVEDLTGIRDRVRLRKPQRAALHSWAFAQLGAFLTYKACTAGVAFIAVNPAYTSQDCHTCGHRDKKNRPNQSTFACQKCGVSLHADENAALNIATRGGQDWGAVNHPHAAEPHQPDVSRAASSAL